MDKLPTRRFFVVIHTITNGLHHAFGEAKVAKWAGADGIFLIPDYAKGNKKATTSDQFLYLAKLKENIPDFPIGVNFLASPKSLIPRLYSVQPDLYQTDSSSVERIDKSQLPNTEFFLGLAFKYSPNVHLTGSALRQHCEKVASLANVPTTSGDATGVEADLNKIREIRSYLPPCKRLGIASGVTQENIHTYLEEGVTDFLVATSLIESVNEDGADVLSSSKISRMAEVVHSYPD
jgi:predicted TIM-barrel enzyme